MSGAIHPLPQYAFMAWCLVKARGQLYLIIIIIIIIIIININIGINKRVFFGYFKVWNIKKKSSF
jgi:hypothetical protein